MPNVGLHINGSGKAILDRGIFVDIFKELSNMLNFSYTTTPPPDGKYGALKEDGTWSGMVGQLHDKRVDIGKLSVSCKINRPTHFYSFL